MARLAKARFIAFVLLLAGTTFLAFSGLMPNVCHDVVAQVGDVAVAESCRPLAATDPGFLLLLLLLFSLISPELSHVSLGGLVEIKRAIAEEGASTKAEIERLSVQVAQAVSSAQSASVAIGNWSSGPGEEVSARQVLAAMGISVPDEGARPLAPRTRTAFLSEMQRVDGVLAQVRALHEIERGNFAPVESEDDLVKVESALALLPTYLAGHRLSVAQALSILPDLREPVERLSRLEGASRGLAIRLANDPLAEVEEGVVTATVQQLSDAVAAIRAAVMPASELFVAGAAQTGEG